VFQLAQQLRLAIGTLILLNACSFSCGDFPIEAIRYFSSSLTLGRFIIQITIIDYKLKGAPTNITE
jgi:hypothetical protein